MDKPASIRRVELRKTIMEAIDNSKLPPYVVTEVLKGILNVSVRNEEYQYRADLARWNEQKEQQPVEEVPTEEAP